MKGSLMLVRRLLTRIKSLENLVRTVKNYRIQRRQLLIKSHACDVLRMRGAAMASAAVIGGPLSQNFSKNVTLSDGAKDEFITEHLYYTDTELCECKAKVTGVRLMEYQGESRHVIIVDQTVMHPQGGGQPADTGRMKKVDGDQTIEFNVLHVQKPSRDSKYIEHIGCYAAGSKEFVVGDLVDIFVDADKRRFHARIHSAGHLLDSAFTNIGWTTAELEPSKGYHFAEGPYVEYIGNIPVEKRDEVIKQLNQESARLIQEKMPVIVSHNDKGERIVNVGGTECPCGGTHVKNTSWIGGMNITKMKKSKKTIRVSYEVTGS